MSDRAESIGERTGLGKISRVAGLVQRKIASKRALFWNAITFQARISPATLLPLGWAKNSNPLKSCQGGDFQTKLAGGSVFN